jgi:hypothetical protein
MNSFQIYSRNQNLENHVLTFETRNEIPLIQMNLHDSLLKLNSLVNFHSNPDFIQTLSKYSFSNSNSTSSKSNGLSFKIDLPGIQWFHESLQLQINTVQVVLKDSVEISFESLFIHFLSSEKVSFKLVEFKKSNVFHSILIKQQPHQVFFYY